MASMEFCQLQYLDKYVSRTMRCLPDKFTELCHIHLAFLMGLSLDKLELLLSRHEEHKKKKSGLPSVGMFKKKDKPQGLFGLPLTHEGVYLMMPLIQFLKMKTNVTKEGLFRKTGNKSRMTTLRELLIAHGPAVSIDPGIFSAHDVACVLKEFIRELPEPLLTERHLEAHRQILALGQHAETPEEISDFSSRKLSAVQFLMLLLPSPAQILTMHLVKLLKRTADSPESKMTSATLGTIFAPIFFIDKKVQATDLLSQISKTAPAASFIIDKAHELFQPPKVLVMDLTKFWKSMKQSLLHTENRESGQMQKSLSGQTLYTDGSVADSNLSVCDDGTSNITAELANLLEQMHKHKDKAKKFFDAPEFCASLRKRSRSIGSTIRKRLPSLKRIKTRQGDVLRSRASSPSAQRSDTKTVTSTEPCQIECSTETFVARCSLELPKPGQKRRHSSENCTMSVSSSSGNPPLKQKCHETATATITLTGNQNHLKNDGCEARLPPNRRSTKVVKKRNFRALPSDLEDPVTCDIENKENIEDPATCDIEKKHSNHRITHFNGKTESANSNILQQNLAHAHTGSTVSMAKYKVSGVHFDYLSSFQSKTSIDHLPHEAVNNITKLVPASRNSKPVTKTRHQRSRRSGTKITSRGSIRLAQENILETSV